MKGKKKDKNKSPQPRFGRVPDYQIRQDFMTLLHRNPVSTFVNELKKVEGFDNLSRAVKMCATFFPPVMKAVEEVPFPEDIVQMCHDKRVFFRPESVLSELNWLTLSLSTYSEKMRFFCQTKRSFEHALLSGNFGLAHSLLDDAKARLGVSLWYYSSLLLLLEYEDNREKSITLHSDILGMCKDYKTSYVPYLFSQLYVRSTKNLSAYKYDSDLESQITKIKNDLHEDYYRYVLFRLNFFNKYEDIDLSTPTSFESVCSLVDRYLLVLSVLQIACLRGEFSDDIRARVSNIYTLTGDSALQPLLSTDEQLAIEGYFNAGYLHILDLYYQGSYADCAACCTDFLQTDTHLFDVYVIYCRCLAYQNLPFRHPLRGEQVPVNMICKNIWQILTGKDTADSLYSLYRTNKNLYGFQLAGAFDYFIKREQNVQVDSRLKMLFCDVFDPKYSGMLQQLAGDDAAQAYIVRFQQNRHLSSIACDHQLKRLLVERDDNPSLAPTLRMSDNALITFQHGNYAEARALFATLYQESPFVPVRQKAVKYQLQCLFEEKNINLLVRQYVDVFISSPNLVDKVDTDSIIRYFIANNYEGVRRNIDLVIFVGLNSPDSIDRSCMLLEYCELKGRELPSELIPDMQDASPRNEIFLRLATDDETLRNYVNIHSMRERLEERERIFKHLLTLDSPWHDIYDQELKAVQYALVVYTISKSMEESKIYANAASIIKYKLKDVDGLYKRYLQYYDMLVSRGYALNVLDLSQVFIFGKGAAYGRASDIDVSISNNGIYDVFNSIYEYVKEQFLNSEYGLVAYLSTRVRHGVLEGELRPELSEAHLILTESNGNYQSTDFWNRRYVLSPEDNKTLNDALRRFSHDFDHTVYSFIKEMLQIRDDSKPKGLFVYQPTVTEISQKAVEIGLRNQDGTKEEFCQQVIDWLWQMTEDSLAEIRSYIANTFSVTIQGHFDALKASLHSNMSRGRAQSDLMKQIDETSSLISGKIKKIENWFYMSGVTLNDIDCELLSNQTLVSVSYAHAPVASDLELQYEGAPFKVRYNFVNHYVDLVRNIVSNIIKHGLPDSDGIRRGQCHVSNDGTYLHLTFRNPIKPGTDDAANAEIEKRMASAIFFGEGGSGIAKIKKIVTSDLRHAGNSLSVYAEDAVWHIDIRLMLSVLKADE